MPWRGFFDMKDFSNRSFLEPGEVLIGKEKFFPTPE